MSSSIIIFYIFSPDARGVVKTIALNDPRVETVVEALPHELEFRINRFIYFHAYVNANIHILMYTFVRQYINTHCLHAYNTLKQKLM